MSPPNGTPPSTGHAYRVVWSRGPTLSQHPQIRLFASPYAAVRFARKLRALDRTRGPSTVVIERAPVGQWVET